MASRYLILDTETTGLPATPGKFGTFFPSEDVDKYNTARVVQLAWCLTDNTFQPLEQYCVLVKPRVHSDTQELDFVHDGEACRINGITQQQLMDDGRDIDEVLDQLLYVLQRQTTHVVAHNAAFDLSVIKSECHRINRHDVLEQLKQVEVVCTMHATRSVLNLPGKYGVKFPRLSEVYEFCFGSGAQIENAHTADGDVEALRKCLVNLRERQQQQEQEQRQAQ